MTTITPEEQAAIVAGLELASLSNMQLLGTDGPNGKPTFTETKSHREIADKARRAAGLPDGYDVLAYAWPAPAYDPALVRLALTEEVVARALEQEAARRA